MTATRRSPEAAVRCRLRRIEGQAAGLRRMWEEGRSAEQMLEQIAALRGALSGAGMEIVHAETKRRLHAAPPISDCPDGQDDILALVDRLMRSR